MSIKTSNVQLAKEIKNKKMLIFNYNDIIKSLSFYKQEHIYLKEAIIKENKINAVFKKFHFPFQIIEPNHLTREQAVLFLTQASYLFVFKFKEINNKWPMSEDFAIRLAINEQMAFSNIDIYFKKFIPNKENVNLEVIFKSFRIIKSKLYIDMNFFFGKECFGSMKGICALDESFSIK